MLPENSTFAERSRGSDGRTPTISRARVELGWVLYNFVERFGVPTALDCPPVRP